MILLYNIEFLKHYLNDIYTFVHYFTNFNKLFILANRVIRSDEVEKAMLAVDRKNYCPTSPYMDAPQPIGYSVTISAPHMVNLFSYFLYYSVVEYIVYCIRFSACACARIFKRSSSSWRKCIGRRLRFWIFNFLHVDNGRRNGHRNWNRSYTFISFNGHSQY